MMASGQPMVGSNSPAMSGHTLAAGRRLALLDWPLFLNFLYFL
jgi:hypothetical protein